MLVSYSKWTTLHFLSGPLVTCLQSMSCPAQPRQRLAPPPNVRLNPFDVVFLFFRSDH